MCSAPSERRSSGALARQRLRHRPRRRRKLRTASTISVELGVLRDEQATTADHATLRSPTIATASPIQPPRRALPYQSCTPFVMNTAWLLLALTTAFC